MEDSPHHLFESLTRNFKDPSAWDGSFYQTNLELDQISTGSFSSKQTIVRLGEMLVSQDFFNQSVRVRGSGQMDAYVVLRYHDAEEGHCNGVQTIPSYLMCFRPFVEIDTCVLKGGFHTSGMFIQTAYFEQCLSVLGDEGLLQKLTGFKALQPEEETLSRLQNCLDWVFKTTKEHSEVIESESLQDSLRTELMTLLFDAMSSDLIADSKPEMIHSRAQELVNQAEKFVLNHPDTPPTLVDLCRETKASAKSLYNAFRMVFGISPILFLKRIRLNHVQKSLKQHSPEQTTVTEQALKWGFWHLGEFSHAYKKMFQELPSETLSH